MKNWLKNLTSPRFCLPQSQSPAYFNLARFLPEYGWIPTQHARFAHLSEKNFLFDEAAGQCLEYKHYLAKLVNHYCPEVMPETYAIHEHNWSAILSHIAEKHYQPANQLVDQIENKAWILKPALLNNGQHIKIFTRLSEIEKHYLSANRLGGPHVLQQYISNPHLLAGKKYSIRLFVIATNYHGVHLYQQGYFNIAHTPYSKQAYFSLDGHLTNEHLHEHHVNVAQVPTQQFDTLFPVFYPSIKTVVTKTIDAWQHIFPHAFKRARSRQIALFGFDFMVDEEMRVWLLEANHGPCFPTDEYHPLQQTLYFPFWRDFISTFIVPFSYQSSLHFPAQSCFDQIDTAK